MPFYDDRHRGIFRHWSNLIEQLTRLPARESLFAGCEIHGDGNLSGREYLRQNFQQPCEGSGIYTEDEGSSFFAESGEVLCETTTG